MRAFKIFARNAQRATFLQKPWSRATLDFCLFEQRKSFGIPQAKTPGPKVGTELAHSNGQNRLSAYRFEQRKSFEIPQAKTSRPKVGTELAHSSAQNRLGAYRFEQRKSFEIPQAKTPRPKVGTELAHSNWRILMVQF